MRIYLGNIEIAGYFNQLKQGFEQLNVKADLWCLFDNKYYDNRRSMLLKLNSYLLGAYQKTRRTILFPLALLAMMGMGMIHAMVFLYSALRYDVFILNAQPFFNYSELRLLKLLKKKIIVVFLGTDSRPAYLSGDLVLSQYMVNGEIKTEACYRKVRTQIRNIRRIEKYADHIINHPPSGMFHKRAFIAWLHIGFPHDSEVRQGLSNNGSSRIVNVLHAPSNNCSKGTSAIVSMIQKLQQEGIPVRLQKLQGVKNDQVLEALKTCDIVLDELYSDVPIGGLGTEAAFAGKWVINGGYYTNDIARDYPSEVIPPSCYCLPENMEYELIQYVADKSQRESKSKLLHDFVRENWTNKTIAGKYLQIIHNNIPDEWMYHPDRITHFDGYGIEKNRLRVFLKQYVLKKGRGALFLQDKPHLEGRLIEFIETKNAAV